MNSELPIVVQPSRVVWGLIAALSAVLVVGIVYFVGFTDAMDGQEEWLSWAAYAFAAFSAVEVAIGVWNCLFAPPRMVVDERGVGGRFAAGFAGAERILWDDIIGARYVSEYSMLVRVRYFFIVLDVNNSGNKYPAAKVARWWSPFAWWEKFLLSGATYTFAFNVTNAKLGEAKAKEVIEAIKTRAKGKPPEANESGKSPFAAD